MTVLFRLTGTFLMFLGFLAMAAGWFLLRTTQEEMGKMFMTTSFLGGGEIPDKRWVRALVSMHGNEPRRRGAAWGMISGGIFLALLGAWVS